MAAAVGRQRLVLDLSCTRIEGCYRIVTDRWQRTSEVVVDRELLADLGASCAEFLVHAAHVEGQQRGADAELVGLLGAASPLPVTYAGGVRSLADLETVRQAGAGRIDVTVGSALDIFGGALPYADVLAWHRRHNRQA
jgi:phosphoribosylformimino-5-aminoimidazole carboxamide ribotide isomerase